MKLNTRVYYYADSGGNPFVDLRFGTIEQINKKSYRIRVVPFKVVSTEHTQYKTWYKPMWSEELKFETIKKNQVFEYPKTHWMTSTPCSGAFCVNGYVKAYPKDTEGNFMTELSMPVNASYY